MRPGIKKRNVWRMKENIKYLDMKNGNHLQFVCSGFQKTSLTNIDIIEKNEF